MQLRNQSYEDRTILGSQQIQICNICTFANSLADLNMAQISTAVSDLVLSISSFYGAGVITRRYIHAAIGLLIIALAAGVGTIRFLNIVPLRRQNAIISLHSKLSWFAAILGEYIIHYLTNRLQYSVLIYLSDLCLTFWSLPRP